jgi:phenylalanyl-tRNA synthetase beta chain
LGQTIEAAFVSRTLGHLGFGVHARNGVGGTVWDVEVPSFRVDVGREIDLIEEVARHHGYDRLPTTFPALTESPPRPGPWLDRNRLIRKVLTASGCSEAITYGFMERAAALAFHPQENDLVAIANPLSEKFAVLRPSLLPGLVDSLIRNRRRERRDIRLFEIGNIYRRSTGERPSAALVWTGAGTVGHWSGGERMVDLFDVKGAIERLGQAVGVPLTFTPAERSDLMAGRTARVTSRDAEIGYVGQLVGAIAIERGLPGGGEDIHVAELDLRALDRLARRGDLRVEALPRYPSIVRDLSIVIADTLSAESVRGTIHAAAGPILISVREFDRYQGQGVPAGSVSLSFRLTFRAPDRTLTDADVQPAMDAVVTSLQTTWGAKLR